MEEKMGVRVLSTTKFCEDMAVEGIECLWRVKQWFHSKPLHMKWKKAPFLELFPGCLDLNPIRTKEKREALASFSKQARSYICAYYAF
jgi:hypothetical protein